YPMLSKSCNRASQSWWLRPLTPRTSGHSGEGAPTLAPSLLNCRTPHLPSEHRKGRRATEALPLIVLPSMRLNAVAITSGSARGREHGDGMGNGVVDGVRPSGEAKCKEKRADEGTNPAVAE